MNGRRTIERTSEVDGRGQGFGQPNGAKMPVEAGRIRKPTWRDPKLGVGVVLVALAIALGMWSVAAAGKTVSVWAASDTLTPGDDLAGKVVAVGVPPELATNYLDAAAVPDGQVDRVVMRGELIPASALTDKGSQLRSIMVPAGTKLPSSVVAGARVDIWLNPKGGDSNPQVVAENVLVASVMQDSSAFATASHGSVEILIDEAGISEVVAALGNGGSLVIVPRTS